MRKAVVRRVVAALAGAAGVGGLVTGSLTAPTVALAGTAAPTRSEQVIVQAVAGGESRAMHAATALGAVVTRDLAIVHGFAARVPAGALFALAANPAVRAVTPDSRVYVQASQSQPGYFNSRPSVYRQVVRADALAAKGYTGRGVTVALIDTGVDPQLPDIAGRLVTVHPDPLGAYSAPCMNFSGEPSCNDSYGHGTFVAGLIAGSGAASGGKYVGTAPGARVLSVKLAGANGSADVSQLLAALQWVVSNRTTYGVRVLNLSLGTNARQSYRLSPLDYAVEQAWKSGIVVVVAASNRGPANGTISKPADDPYVVTVGATDDRGTVGLGDDAVPGFSSRGPTAADGLAKPDVVAPGAHVVSLAAPGATITTTFPSTMPAPYRRGSGTSFSAGVVSGAVADILSATPSMTPDRVKYALAATARPDASTDRNAVGAGVIDAYRAALAAPAGLANQGLTPSSGKGSLDGDRGTVTLSGTTDGVTTALTGDATFTGRLFNLLDFLTGSWTPLGWFGSQWVGDNWTGDNWTSGSWYGNSWTGSAWYGAWDR